MAGTHFKRSMAQVAKQPRTELTASKAAVVDARRFMRRVCLCMSEESSHNASHAAQHLQLKRSVRQRAEFLVVESPFILIMKITQM